MARKSKKRAASPQLPESTWWDGLSGAVQHAICIAALLVIALGFFAPVLFSDLSLIGGDTVQWRSMANFILEYEEETGNQALWAPNAFAGMPGYMISYATQVPGIDDVPALLREAMWPVSHYIFLLLGTYLLIVYLTRDKLAGVFAAAAYGLTTYLIILLPAGHNSKFISLSFAPWMVLAFAHVIRQPKLLSALLFAIAAGVNLRAGHVQITYYVTFLLGIWWVVEAVGAIRRKEWKPFAASTGWLALGSVLAVLMVAQPYLANWEYKRYTIRGSVEEATGGLDWAYAMGWSQGVGELVTLIAADAFGGASPTYWGPKRFTGGPHYIGIIPVVLAVLALARRRTNLVIGFSIAAFLMTLFSLGEHFEALNRLMYDHFPLFSAFRVPETWLSMVALAVAVLAGIGLWVAARKQDDEDAPHDQSANRAVYGVLAGAAGLLLVLWMFGDVFFDYEKPGEGEQIRSQILQQYPDISPDDPRVDQSVSQVLVDLREERADMYGNEMLRSLIFLILAAGVLVLHRRRRIPAWAMQSVLVLFVVVDLWGVGRRYFNEEHLVRANEVEDQVARYDFDQFLIDRAEEEGGHGRFRVLSLESGNPFINARPSYFHESLGGYHGAKLRLIQDYIDELFVDPATGLPNENALDLLNTRYIVARGTLPGTEPVYRGEQTGLVVLENPDALPRAFLVGEVEVIEDEEAVWERIRSDAFDPRETAILSEPLQFELAPIDSGGTARVEMESYSPREIVWNVETDAPRLLVASEIYYPAGWKAYVDGEEVPIRRANHLLRAVPVPEGNHRVEMRFDPASHRAGVWISGITALIVYGLAIVLAALPWYRRRKERPAEEPISA